MDKVYETSNGKHDATNSSESKVSEKPDKKNKPNSNRDETIPVWLMMNSVTE